MSRLKVWEGRRFLGTFDLDSDVRASETIELLGDPPEPEFRWKERSFVEVYRLHDGKVVIREVDVQRIPNNATLLSQDEAISWFTSRGYDVPQTVNGGIQSAVASTQSKPVRPGPRSCSICGEFEFTDQHTQSDIDSLVQLRDALLSFELASRCGFTSCEEYPEAIGELSAFAFRAPKGVIDSAARVPTESAVCLSMMGELILDECKRLGIDSFAEWLRISHLRRRNELCAFEGVGGWIADLFYRVACRRADPSCKDLNSNVPFNVAVQVVNKFESCAPDLDTETAVLAAARGAMGVVDLGFAVGTTDVADVPFPVDETTKSSAEETYSVDQSNYLDEKTPSWDNEACQFEFRGYSHEFQRRENGVSPLILDTLQRGKWATQIAAPSGLIANQLKYSCKYLNKKLNIRVEVLKVDGILLLKWEPR